MSVSEKIRNAPNVSAANRLLPDNMAIIASGGCLWTVTVNGNARGFPESFDDARRRAAELLSD